MMYCVGSQYFPTDDCPGVEDIRWWYSVLSMAAMIMHWILIVDLSVLSTNLSAFVLVFTTVLSEVLLFLVALCFLILTFASAISCLRRDQAEFKDVPTSFVSLFAITLLMMPRDYRELQHDPALLVAVFLFVTASVILLLNLLIAQLNCSYEYIYQDVVGNARLTRAAVIAESLDKCPVARWVRFLGKLRLDQKVEFNEGDVGLAGAIQLSEPASLNPVTTERILRYGGTCSAKMRWPDEKSVTKDRLERMEHLVRKALKKVTTKARGRGRNSVGSKDVGSDSDASSASGSMASSIETPR